mgnify:CR=1 FL=1
MKINNNKPLYQMTRPISKLCVCLCAVILASSCVSSRKIAYFRDIDESKLPEAFQDYEPTIKKDDQLNIIVSGPNKEVVMPYNQTLGDNISGIGSTIPYLVDADGCINFPILGRMYVAGLTSRQLADRLTAEIAKDVKNPIVNISFLNYRVTILGEVHAPGTYTLPNEKTTLLQALGMAGDLTITGKRKNVLLIRENERGYEYARIDLSKTELLSSPYYYISQNDVIYVAPVTARIASATTPTTIFSLTTSTLSFLLTIVLLIL